MSILQQLLNEMQQSEMHFSDGMADLAEKVAHELISSGIQIQQEMAEDEDDEYDMEINSDTIIEHAESLLEDIFETEVMEIVKREAPKYLKQLEKE